MDARKEAATEVRSEENGSRLRPSGTQSGEACYLVFRHPGGRARRAVGPHIADRAETYGHAARARIGHSASPRRSTRASLLKVVVPFIPPNITSHLKQKSDIAYRFSIISPRGGQTETLHDVADEQRRPATGWTQSRGLRTVPAATRPLATFPMQTASRTMGSAASLTVV